MSVTQALARITDAVRRLDPAYCASHLVEQVTDAELDAALMAAEDALEMAVGAEVSA